MTLHNQDSPTFRVGDLVTGTVQHFDGAAADLHLGTIDALLPRAELASFTRLDGVDFGLADKLVEQGILSFRDLSVVPISDLVERVDGLSDELAARVLAQAEVLAEKS